MFFKDKIRTRIQDPRVLVIDDEVQLAELLRAVFRTAGANVQVIYDAADAETVIADFKPDVILSDVSMPEMRGDELLAHLREAELHIPVIFLTGVDRSHISLDPHDPNPYLILYKPVPHEILIRSVENALMLKEERLINAELLQKLHGEAGGRGQELASWSQEAIDEALLFINRKRSA